MKNLFILFLIVTSISKNGNAEFAQTSTRYISNYDFQQKLSPFFELFWYNYNNSSSIVDGCFAQQNPLGFSNPATGEPAVLVPSTATVDLLNKCITLNVEELQRYIRNHYNPLPTRQQLLQNFLRSDLVERLTVNVNGLEKLMDSNLSSINEELRTRMAADLVESFLGTDATIKSFGFIQNPDDYRKFILSQFELEQTVGFNFMKIIKLLVLRDEFLTF